VLILEQPHNKIHPERDLDKHITVSTGAAQALTQVGGVTALSSGLVGWLTENHIIITSAGILVGVLVGLTGIYVQLSKSRLENQEARLRIKKLKKEGQDGNTKHTDR